MCVGGKRGKRRGAGFRAEEPTRRRQRMLRSGASKLRGALVVVRDVGGAVEFLGPNGLGLPVVVASPTSATLGGVGSDDMQVGVQACQFEAECTQGYSPFLCVDVPDLDATVPNLIMKGAVLDGAVRHEVDGKFAVLRAPQGFMLALREPPELPPQDTEAPQDVVKKAR